MNRVTHQDHVSSLMLTVTFLFVCQPVSRCVQQVLLATFVAWSVMLFCICRLSKSATNWVLFLTYVIHLQF